MRGADIHAAVRVLVKQLWNLGDFDDVVKPFTVVDHYDWGTGRPLDIGYQLLQR